MTLKCVSLTSTRKVSNVTREIVASGRTRLAKQLLLTLVSAREITRACTNCGMPLESAILNHELPLFNLRDRCMCATPTFKPTQIGLLLYQKPLYTHEMIVIMHRKDNFIIYYIISLVFSHALL